MAEAYATVDEYRVDSGDETSDDDRVEAMLSQQSAKLRAKAGISATRVLTDDQKEMCRFLVTDACRKALVIPEVSAFGPMTGLTQGTFSANGFSGSFQNANGSGTAYFDRDTLKALMKSLGNAQGAGMIIPSYGRLNAR